MTMSRRDTILLAALINAALLSLLFVTATRPDRDPSYEPIVTTSKATFEPIPMLNPDSGLRSHFVKTEEKQEPTTPSQPFVIEETTAFSRDQYPLRDRTDETLVAAQEMPSGNREEPVEQAFVEVTVKRGDFLEKIARANGSTVSEIKRINSLPNDRIDIGQVLLIPIGDKQRSARAKPVSIPQQVAESSSDDAEYYVMKPGDNPWNIARQHRVNFDEFLRLNQLDEEKARQLKPGDKLRVR